MNISRAISFLGTRSGALALAMTLLLSAPEVLRAAPCTGPGAPANTQTQCVTAIAIPGNALRSFDISWVDSKRGLYFLADRNNAGVDIISTVTNTWIGRAGGFKGIVLRANGTVNNNKSGPAGVVTHGRWLYAGDGDSTLKVYDTSDPTLPVQKASISTGGSTRVDEMAITTDGTLLLVINNAEDPPFGTLIAANGDNPVNSVTQNSIIRKITVDPAILPATFGLSIEQPAWDLEKKKHGDDADDEDERRDGHTGLFYASIPTIANNPAGCNYGQLPGDITCSGGLLIVNPADPLPADQIVKKANDCGPNGIAIGPHDNILQGCTPGNRPADKSTFLINGDTFHFLNIGGITGSDEVWFSEEDKRYYTASNNQTGGAVLGVINAKTNLLIETVPQSSGSHSVAVDSERNSIYVPEAAPVVAGVPGGDTTAVGAGICGTNNGCIAVYTNSSEDDD